MADNRNQPQSQKQETVMNSISLSNLDQVPEPVTHEVSSLIQSNLITQDAKETGLHTEKQMPRSFLINKDCHFGAKTSFWQCLSHPAYTDINLVFEDGELPVNKAVLAALSSMVAASISDHNDAFFLPELKMQDFLDFVVLFTDQSATKATNLPDSVADIVNILDVQIFQPNHEFLNNISNLKRLMKAKEILKPVNHSKRIDLFAPGYANKNKPTTESLKVEKSPSDKKAKEETMDSDHFIDDDELSEDEYWNEENKIFQTQRQEKQSNYVDSKAAPQSGQYVEVLLDKNDATTRFYAADVTMDEVVFPFLKCHDCHQVGYSSMADMINHLRSTHKWTHQVNHCVFCDLPFMEKSKCIKHELDGCKNVDNKCYKCGKGFDRKIDMMDHLVRAHRHGIRRRCPHCENDFLTLMHLGLSKWPHIEKCYAQKNEDKKTTPVGKPKGTKGEPGKKTCDDCGGTFKDTWKHKRQCTAVNKDIKFICYACKKGFRRLGAVKKHFKLFSKCKTQNQNQKEYEKLMKYVENNIKGKTVCQDCGCEYVTRKGPQEHRKNCSTYTQFKCYSCNRGINAMDGFHIHFSKFPECRKAPVNAEIVAEIVARSQKPEFHVCYLCGAQYKAKESIEKHMLTHSETIDYLICKQPDCDKKFINQKALDMHMKNHVMPKVICSICGKQVKQGSMPLHMILHTGKKIECHLCGKLFQHKGVLNKHIRTMHNDKKPNKDQKEKRRQQKKAIVNPGPVANEDVALVQDHPPIQTIQVQLDAGDGQQRGEAARVAQQLQHGARVVSTTSNLQASGSNNTVTLINGLSGSQPLQAYSQNVMIPSVPINVLNSNNLQQFLQLGGQQRYQS